jgi:uncharacterized protein
LSSLRRWVFSMAPARLARMDASDLVLLILGASKAPVRGRTVIQKTGYFTHVSAPEAKSIGFKPHFFGPYSPEIAAALGDLVGMGYVHEDADTTARGNAVYTYALTKDGRSLAQNVKKSHLSAFEAIKKIEQTCRDDAQLNPNILSWAAKTYFLLREKRTPLSTAEAVEMGKDFNWELSEEDLGRGVQLLLKLGLVKKTS